MFQTTAIVGSADIYLDALPHPDNKIDCNFVSLLSDTVPTSPCCHSTIPSTDKVIQKRDPNLLKSLRQYYSTVKTKRQLNLNVPAGFCQSSDLQKDFHEFLPAGKLRSSDSMSSDQLQELTIASNLLASEIESPDTTTVPSPTIESIPVTNNSSLARVPIIRCVDKTSTPLPSCITLTEDYIRSSVGFRRIDTIKAHFRDLYQETVKIDTMPADAVLDKGDIATIRKSNPSTTPVSRPPNFGDVIHMDIVFGPDITFGNVHYGLLFMDRSTRMTYIYPLQNLTSDIRKQIKAFFAHLGFNSRRLITDFDTKLIGGKAREYLNGLLIHVNAAPAYRQDKNGLAERHWQTIIAMAWNWLASAELPGTFWFFAVKRAAEVCNYFPTKTDHGSWTTPFEQAHGVKPDLRVLFRLFSVAAVRRERMDNNTLGKFDSRSVSMIAVGRCPNSTGIQFYNPSNGTLVSSIDYKFQPNVTSGSHFGLKYQPGLFIYRLDESSTIFTSNFPLDSSVYVHTHSPPSVGKIIGLPSYDKPNVYTVVFCDGNISEYMNDLLSASPTASSNPPSSLLPKWMKSGANATFFQCNMPKPRHGTLQVSSEGIWTFFPGKSIDKNGIILHDFEANCQESMDTGQLFKGHAKFSNVHATRSQISLKDSVLRHVSAHRLHSLIAPLSLKHHTKMCESDKAIWDSAYESTTV
jgi:hypothetical protein